MLYLYCGLIILICGYAQIREGLFTALVMCISAVFAGVVTFNFFEPTAKALDDLFAATFLADFTDFLAMVLIFAGCLAVLRAVANNYCKEQLELNAMANQIGGGVLGLVTGYFVAGILVCALQTLPLHKNFMGFEPYSDGEAPVRRYFPPDRVWLAMMRHAGAYPFAGQEVDEKAESRYGRFATFDRAGTFELRYLRYRRVDDAEKTKSYFGELDKALENR